MDLIIRDASLMARDGRWDIGIEGDRIAAVERNLAGGVTEIDAKLNLVTPSYVNGHVHLDKCNLGNVMRPNKSNSFQECLEITWEHKRDYTIEDIVARASRAIEEGILNGTTVFRVFADVDSIGGLRPLEGILTLRNKWQGIIRIEVVAFPQEGLVMLLRLHGIGADPEQIRHRFGGARIGTAEMLRCAKEFGLKAR
jgi:cytosine/creatinine deaminase